LETFELSPDARFVDKVRDIVGLYVNPPEIALVLCVDEKTQVRALDRTAPVLPLLLGSQRGTRTTTCATALPISMPLSTWPQGQMITDMTDRHRAQESVVS
jgi:hypothetical protein